MLYCQGRCKYRFSPWPPLTPNGRGTIYYTWAGVGVLAHYMVFIVTAAQRGGLITAGPPEEVPPLMPSLGGGGAAVTAEGSARPASPGADSGLASGDESPAPCWAFSDITQVRMSRYLIPAL